MLPVLDGELRRHCSFSCFNVDSMHTVFAFCFSLFALDLDWNPSRARMVRVDREVDSSAHANKSLLIND